MLDLYVYIWLLVKSKYNYVVWNKFRKFPSELTLKKNHQSESFRTEKHFSNDLFKIFKKFFLSIKLDSTGGHIVSVTRHASPPSFLTKFWTKDIAYRNINKTNFWEMFLIKASLLFSSNWSVVRNSFDGPMCVTRSGLTFFNSETK